MPDYWIDLGDVTYGDPDIDFGSMMFVSHHIPSKQVAYLYHISRKQFREFVRIFGQEYFGERWDTPELNAKLHDVLLVTAGNSILKRPAAGFIYRPLINGLKFRYALRLALMNLLVISAVQESEKVHGIGPFNEVGTTGVGLDRDSGGVCRLRGTCNAGHKK